MGKQKEAGTALATTDEFFAALATQNQEAAVPSVENEGQLFIPQVVFFTGTSEPIKEGLITMDTYGLKIDDRIVPLGKTVDVLFLARRSRAQCFIGDELCICFDSEHQIYKWIQSKADTAQKTRNVEDKMNYKYGVDVLLWIPSVGEDIGPTFATCYFGRNPTCRRLARSHLAGWVRQPKPVQLTLASKPAKGGGTTYTAQTLRPVEKEFPVDFDQTFAFKVLEEFSNPENKVPELENDTDDDVVDVESEVVR